MKSFLLLGIMIMTISCTPLTKIYIIRHAEKVDNSKDPDLSDVGKARADRLSQILHPEHIQQIYSTDYKRTKQTAEPIRKMNDIAIDLYSPDTLKSFAKVLMHQKVNTLVVGHSNSTLSLIEALGLKCNVKMIVDSDYSNLFKITKRGEHGKMKLEELKY